MIAIEREKKEENMRDKRNVERNMQIRESIDRLIETHGELYTLGWMQTHMTRLTYTLPDTEFRSWIEKFNKYPSDMFAGSSGSRSDNIIIIKISYIMERSMIKKEKQVYGEFEKMIRDEICISLPSIDGINGTVSETYYRFKNLTRAEKEYTASMFWFNKLNGDTGV